MNDAYCPWCYRALHTLGLGPDAKANTFTLFGKELGMAMTCDNCNAVIVHIKRDQFGHVRLDTGGKWDRAALETWRKADQPPSKQWVPPDLIVSLRAVLAFYEASVDIAKEENNADLDQVMTWAFVRTVRRLIK